MRTPKGMHSRGYLPHLDVEDGIQFVTWRLWDSIPLQVIKGWEIELKALSDRERQKTLQSRIEKYLDAGHGSCLLKISSAAIAAQDALLESEGKLIQLKAWSIMPNHVHAVFRPVASLTLGTIVGRLKGASSRAINKVLGRSGPLWQEEYFDRLIRNDGHLERTVKYVEWNAVKAKLTTDPKHWPFSSASPRQQEKLSAMRKSADNIARCGKAAG